MRRTLLNASQDTEPLDHMLPASQADGFFSPRTDTYNILSLFRFFRTTWHAPEGRSDQITQDLQETGKNWPTTSRHKVLTPGESRINGDFAYQFKAPKIL